MMNPFDVSKSPELFRLYELAADADAHSQWPAESWALVKQLGALGWSIPTRYGGWEAGIEDVLRGYQELAGACLTSCFILSQRDAASRRILMSENDALKSELLPPLASGDAFSTVGLSQLTTSRQHGKPVFIIRQDSNGIILDGMIPWVTGASQAAFLVVGGSLEDGRQILAVLPADRPGVRIGEPMDLMALKGSMTTEVYCDEVRLDSKWILAGPVENVMKGGQGGAGGLQTSCLALGLAAAPIAYLKEEANERPGLLPGTERLEKNLNRLNEEMFRIAREGATPEATTSLRAQANSLVLQASQAALIAGKGTGYVHPHPAQRWVRQAMFFLVWSCPWPAAAATLDFLTFRSDQECV